MFSTNANSTPALPMLAVRGGVGADRVSGQANWAHGQNAVQGALPYLPLSQGSDSDALSLGNCLPHAHAEFHPHTPLPGRSNVV